MSSHRPDVGAVCCALMLVAAPFDFAIPQDGFGPYFIRPLMTLIAMLALTAMVVNRDRLDLSLVRASTLFVFALATASAVSVDPDLGYAATLRIAVAVLAFLAASVSVTEVREARIVIAGAATMAVIASVIGFAVLANDGELFFTDSLVGKISVTNGVTRLTRPFSQANIAAMGLGPISVLLIVASAVDVASSRGRRFAIAVAGVFGAIACILTLSRGGVAALVVALAISAVVLRPGGVSKWLLPFGVAFVAGTAWLWLPRWGARVDGVSTGAERSPSRTEIWSQAIDAFQNHPLTGTGPGQFGRYSIGVVAEGVAPSPHAHNVVLEIMATAGLLGVVSLAILVTFVFQIVGRGSWRSMNQLPFLFATITVAVHALGDYQLVFTSAGVVAAVVVGGLVGMVIGSDAHRQRQPSRSSHLGRA